MSNKMTKAELIELCMSYYFAIRRNGVLSRVYQRHAEKLERLAKRVDERLPGIARSIYESYEYKDGGDDDTEKAYLKHVLLSLELPADYYDEYLD